VLSDAQKRAAYDQFGHGAFENGMGGGGNPFGAGVHPEDIFQDLFSQVFGAGGFGGGRRRGGPQRGADLRYDLEITLAEAFAARTKPFTCPRPSTARPAKGLAPRRAPTPETCDTCGGAGRVRAQQGFFTMERTCPRCNGKGKTIKKPCKDCGGAGQVREERN
jgi:molecular chaperone DnaJ